MRFNWTKRTYLIWGRDPPLLSSLFFREAEDEDVFLLCFFRESNFEDDILWLLLRAFSSLLELDDESDELDEDEDEDEDVDVSLLFRLGFSSSCFFFVFFFLSESLVSFSSSSDRLRSVNGVIYWVSESLLVLLTSSKISLSGST